MVWTSEHSALVGLIWGTYVSVHVGTHDKKKSQEENKFYLSLQSPQPMVKVSAYCQLFNHTIHS